MSPLKCPICGKYSPGQNDCCDDCGYAFKKGWRAFGQWNLEDENTRRRRQLLWMGKWLVSIAIWLAVGSLVFATLRPLLDQGGVVEFFALMLLLFGGLVLEKYIGDPLRLVWLYYEFSRSTPAVPRILGDPRRPVVLLRHFGMGEDPNLEQDLYATAQRSGHRGLSIRTVGNTDFDRGSIA